MPLNEALRKFSSWDDARIRREIERLEARKPLCGRDGDMLDGLRRVRDTRASRKPKQR